MSINQTMYEVFFSTIGILIGLLQAIIFERLNQNKRCISEAKDRRHTRKKAAFLSLPLEMGRRPFPNKKRNITSLVGRRARAKSYYSIENGCKNTEFIDFFILIIQELLLFSFMISLIYIYSFGTYIYRNLPHELTPFQSLVCKLQACCNAIVLLSILGLFIFNFILIIAKTETSEEFKISIVGLAVLIILIFLVGAILNKPLKLTESTLRLQKFSSTLRAVALHYRLMRIL